MGILKDKEKGGSYQKLFVEEIGKRLVLLLLCCCKQRTNELHELAI
jgi:hypothetical protein